MTVWGKVKQALRAGALADAMKIRLGALFCAVVAVLMRPFVRVRPGRVMLFSYDHRLGGDLKYIALELLRRPQPLELVWVAQGALPAGLPAGVRTVQRGSLDFVRQALGAQVWVEDSVNFADLHIPKRMGQACFQTWHGSLGIKRFDEAAIGPGRWMRAARKCGRMTDYCISNSRYDTEQVFHATFWPHCEVLECGHPRNDILFGTPAHAAAVRAAVAQRYGIRPGEKIALYAPTYRNDVQGAEYGLDHAMLARALGERFGGEWVVAVRHHRLGNAARAEAGARVVDVTGYEDIQELMLAADVGLTDYSSWIYDYMLLERPGFTFVAEGCALDGGKLNYPLEAAPFPCAYGNTQLAGQIGAFDADAYRQRVRAFLARERCSDDGHAAARVAESVLCCCGFGEG